MTVGARWGFCLFPKGCQTPTTRDEAILTQRGPVVLNAESKLFTGATRLTNNTAEMSALIEVYWFLLTIHTPHPSSVNRRRHVTMRTGDKVTITWIPNMQWISLKACSFPRKNVLMANCFITGTEWNKELSTFLCAGNYQCLIQIVPKLLMSGIFSFCCVPARLYASWQTRRIVKPHRPQMRKCRARTTCGVLCCAQRTTTTLGNAWPSSCATAAKQTCRKPATSPSSSTRWSGNRLTSSSTGSRNQVNPITWHPRPAVLEMRSLNERLSHGKHSTTRACRSRNSLSCAEKLWLVWIPPSPSMSCE